MDHAPSALSSNRLPCEKHQMFGLLLFAVWQGSLSNETLTWNKQTDRLSQIDYNKYNNNNQLKKCDVD